MSVSEKVHTGISENSIGALSYLTVIPAIFFLAIAPYNRSSYVRFHAWQSTILGVIVFLVNFALNALVSLTHVISMSVVLGVSGVLSAAYIVAIIICSVRALNGKRTRLPLIGAWCERQAER
jgi:uncharacterized membrane protein